MTKHLIALTAIYTLPLSVIGRRAGRVTRGSLGLLGAAISVAFPWAD